jgi:hypothetical protein
VVVVGDWHVEEKGGRMMKEEEKWDGREGEEERERGRRSGIKGGRKGEKKRWD